MAVAVVCALPKELLKSPAPAVLEREMELSKFAASTGMSSAQFAGRFLIFRRLILSRD